MKLTILVVCLIHSQLLMINSYGSLTLELTSSVDSYSEGHPNPRRDEPTQAQPKGAAKLLSQSIDLDSNKKKDRNLTVDDKIFPNVNSTQTLGFNFNNTNSRLHWIQHILASLSTTASTPLKPSKCPKCQCGISNPPIRIVNGYEVRIRQYPWVAYLMYRGKFWCAASVINDRYLLTASHCVDRFDKTQITVRIGDHDRNDITETTPIDYGVLDVIKHSGYSNYNYDNDIALLKIDGKIDFKGFMRPVCLPKRGPTFAGENATVTGWGATEEFGPSSNVLRQVHVPIMTNAECRATKYPPRRITDNMMCAGFWEGGKDSCQGDSGGPLLVIEDKTYKVAGIVSWGEGCASPGYPGVYTRVNRYITWIEQNTDDACHC